MVDSGDQYNLIHEQNMTVALLVPGKETSYSIANGTYEAKIGYNKQFE